MAAGAIPANNINHQIRHAERDPLDQPRAHAGLGDGEPVLRPADPELAVRVPAAPLGARREQPADEPHRRQPQTVGLRLADSEAAETPRGAVAARHRRDREGHRDRRPAVRPHPVHQRRASSGRPLEEPAGERLARDARDRAPAAALAQPRLQRHPPVLLSSRGRRDADLADGGRAEGGQSRPRIPRPPGGRQQPGDRR